MRWTSLSAKRFSCTKLSKHTSDVFSLNTATSSVTSRTQLEFHRFHFCCYHHASAEGVFSDKSLVDSLHSNAVKTGRVRYLDVVNYLLSLYVKSKNLDCAHKLFDEISDRDVRSWTILISGLTQNGSFRKVLELFREMQLEGVCANQFTLSSVLKCVSSLSDSYVARGIHGWILRNGIDLDVILKNSIIDVYMKCGAFCYAERLFERMREKGTVTLNIMIGAYMRAGDTEKSLDLFRRLPSKDVASWNTVIDGLMRNGCERSALELLQLMVKQGPPFDKVTFSIALVLASSLVVLEMGRQIHGFVFSLGLHNDGFIISSLVNMYCKCGEMQMALPIYRNMSIVNLRTLNSKVTYDESMTEIVSLSALISGYVRNNEYEDALQTFISMVRENIRVDKFTVTSITSACANVGSLELGQEIHAYIEKMGHKIDHHLGTSLIDMYSKCGSLNGAWTVFKQIINPNVVLWTSMISACSIHGQGQEAAQLFELMIKEGISPNEVSFVTILTACSHAGLVKEGCKYFSMMKEIYGINPGAKHFTCMVDLYGRAGRLDEIKDFIYKNGISHLSSVWKCFLSSCRLHKNIEMGKWVYDMFRSLEPSDAGSFVLLSNMCAANHRWEEAANLRSLMKQRRINKLPGQSWIQMKAQLYTFVMGDRSHPNHSEIYSYLDELIGRLKEIGYSPDVNLVMQDVEEEQGEVFLGCHSEKLALAFGIISTKSGTPIRIIKNLRICTDCHSFMKYTSQLLGREIILRDNHRFHRFKHGFCSCGDYW